MPIACITWSTTNLSYLQTPNFALETADLVLPDEEMSAPQETARENAPQEIAAGQETRYTAHLFNITTPEILGRRPANCRVRVPLGNARWPPDVLFEASYAAAVLHQFPVTEMKEAINELLVRCHPKPLTRSEMEKQHLQDMASQRGKAREEDINARNCQHTSRTANKVDNAAHGGLDAGDSDYGELDGFDMLRFLPFIRMSPEALLEYERRCRQEAEAREREVSTAKVNEWRDQVTRVH